MSKELWIIIAVIIALLAPFGLAKLNGTEKELLGWAESFLPKSSATSSTGQGTASETDLWLQSGAGV